MCLLESFCRFEVRTHVKNKFFKKKKKKSLALVCTCAKESYLDV